MRQIEGGLHDATLDKSPGSGLQFLENWDGAALRGLVREARPMYYAWQEKLSVFEHNNPVPAWAVYGVDYVRPDAPIASREPHPTARTQALLDSFRSQFLGGKA